MLRTTLAILIMFTAVQEIDAGPFGRFQRSRRGSSGGHAGYLSFPSSTPSASPCANGNCPRPALTVAPTIQTQIATAPANPQALIGTKVFTPPKTSAATTSTTLAVKLSKLEQAKAALATAEAEVKAALAEEKYQASREEVAIRAEYALQQLDNAKALAEIKVHYDAMRLKAGLAPVDQVPAVAAVADPPPEK